MLKSFHCQVHDQLEETATSNIMRFFLPLAKNAQHISEKTVYGAIFGAVCRSLGQTEQVAFHSRNIANQLEARLIGQAWFKTSESRQNGQVPQAIAMAELKAGLQDEALCEVDLEADLSKTTEHVRNLWPWTSQLRKRHIQTIYNESHKFLKMVSRGSPCTMIRRVHKAVTWEFLQATIERKEKRILRKSLWKPKSGKKKSKRSKSKTQKKQT